MRTLPTRPSSTNGMRLACVYCREFGAPIHVNLSKIKSSWASSLVGPASGRLAQLRPGNRGGKINHPGRVLKLSTRLTGLSPRLPQMMRRLPSKFKRPVLPRKRINEPSLTQLFVEICSIAARWVRFQRPRMMGPQTKHPPLVLLATMVAEPEQYSSALIAEDKGSDGAMGYGVGDSVLGEATIYESSRSGSF